MQSRPECINKGTSSLPQIRILPTSTPQRTQVYCSNYQNFCQNLSIAMFTCCYFVKPKLSKQFEGFQTLRKAASVYTLFSKSPFYLRRILSSVIPYFIKISIFGNTISQIFQRPKPYFNALVFHSFLSVM